MDGGLCLWSVAVDLDELPLCTDSEISFVANESMQQLSGEEYVLPIFVQLLCNTSEMIDHCCFY